MKRIFRTVQARTRTLLIEVTFSTTMPMSTFVSGNTGSCEYSDNNDENQKSKTPSMHLFMYNACEESFARKTKKHEQFAIDNPPKNA